MILVTGGTGVVGAHLLVELARKNKPIVAIYRRKEGIEVVRNLFKTITPELLKSFEQIQWKKATLNDVSALNEAFEGVQYVYHCAAKVSFADYKAETLKKSNF